MTLARSRVLVIEDNEVDREAVRRALPEARVREAETLAAGLDALAHDAFDCVLLDLGLPDASHTEGLIQISDLHPEVPVVVLTGIEDQELGIELLHLGAQDYLCKNEVSAQILDRVLRYAAERQQLVGKLRSSERRYRSLLENASSAMFVLSEDGNILETNRAGESLLAGLRKNLVGRNFLDFVPPAMREHASELLARVFRSGETGTEEIVCAALDGAMRHVAFSASLIRGENQTISVASVTDITELRELHERLVQSQKMESLGRLAGGVAHDFNNLLTVILTCARFAEEEIDEADPRRGDLSEIASAAERAAGLTRQLLAFARRQPIEPQVVLLTNVIRNVHRLLERTVGEHITLDLELAEAIWPTLVDPGQFEQVIVNLAVNARDAMPDGGRLVIAAQNAPGAAAGADAVSVRITDTGMGIPASIQHQIFQPFFTTKEVGKGTGLGLATCYGLIQQAGGDIRFESTENRGTTFEIRLPRSLAVTVPPESQTERPRSGGQGRVLLVEDEPRVARAATQSLRRAGYEVFPSSNADEARSVFARHGASFDLLLTDVIMPGTSGIELAAQLRQRCPGLRILFMTGYTDTSIKREPGTDVVLKPFYPETLVRKVRAILRSAEEIEPAIPNAEASRGPSDAR